MPKPSSTSVAETKPETTLDKNCKFCTIIRDEKKAVTYIYHGPWDKEVLILQPINPATEGHILVIPRTHVPDSRPAEVFARTAFWPPKVAETLYPNTDVNFQLNQGKHAGQTVGHAHLHIVKCCQGDGLPHFWDRQENGNHNIVKTDDIHWDIIKCGLLFLFFGILLVYGHGIFISVY